MIERGAELFDELVIGIGINPDKRAMFTEEERHDMILGATANIQNIAAVGSFEGYLFDFAEQCNATHLLRGIRNGADFEYERTMRNLNRDFSLGIETVFLMPPRELAEISSSTVKGLIGPKGWQRIIKPMVPENVYLHLLP